MTLLGAEKYLNSKNLSLADKFDLSTIPNFDADVLLATMVRNFQSLPCLYEDPDYQYDETDFWWKQHKADYARMFLAVNAEYNPIENYDRTETRTGASTTIGNNSSTKGGTVTVDSETKGTGTITEVLDGETKGTGSLTEVLDGETKGTGTIGVAGTVDTTVTVDQEDTHNTENRVSAFNESTYQNASKVIEDGTLDNTTTTDTDTSETTTRNTKDEVDNTTTTTRNLTDTVDNETTTTRNTKDELDSTTTTSETVSGTDSSTTNDSYTLNIHGNIGVTTNQQMITAELELRLKNIYTLIAKQYSDEMLLSIW